MKPYKYRPKINKYQEGNELGYKNIALGFISGFTGKYIVDSMIAKNLNCDFIELSNGFTRINVKIKTKCNCRVKM